MILNKFKAVLKISKIVMNKDQNNDKNSTNLTSLTNLPKNQVIIG
jgi:hypothetical protein